MRKTQLFDFLHTLLFFWVFFSDELIHCPVNIIESFRKKINPIICWNQVDSWKITEFTSFIIVSVWIDVAALLIVAIFSGKYTDYPQTYVVERIYPDQKLRHFDKYGAYFLKFDFIISSAFCNIHLKNTMFFFSLVSSASVVSYKRHFKLVETFKIYASNTPFDPFWFKWSNVNWRVVIENR